MSGGKLPNLVRRSTIVAGISYTFPPDDATGFPDLLPEARKIGLGRRSLTGLLTSARKSNGLGPFESALERDYFVLLEFDRRVIAWHPQPVRLVVPAGAGKRARPYTPDVAVEYANEPDGKTLDHVELCEIKYREELKARWQEIKPSLKAGFKYARGQGWRFGVYTEIEIRTPRLWNAKFFLPYAVRGTSEEDIARLGQLLEHEGPSTPSLVLTRCQSDFTERARLLAALWHMVATGIVGLDFNQQANMNTRIWLNENVRY